MKRKTPETGLVSINVQCECGRLHKLKGGNVADISIDVGAGTVWLSYLCPESKKRKEILL